MRKDRKTWKSDDRLSFTVDELVWHAREMIDEDLDYCHTFVDPDEWDNIVRDIIACTWFVQMESSEQDREWAKHGAINVRIFAECATEIAIAFWLKNMYRGLLSGLRREAIACDLSKNKEIQLKVMSRLHDTEWGLEGLHEAVRMRINMSIDAISNVQHELNGAIIAGRIKFGRAPNEDYLRAVRLAVYIFRSDYTGDVFIFD